MAEQDQSRGYTIDGVAWRSEKNQMPQPILAARAQDGEKLVIVIPKDWNHPFQAKGNAVLMSRTVDNPQWRQSSSMDFREAVKRGTHIVKEYERDKQIAAMRAEEYSPALAKSIRDFRHQDRRIKLASRQGRQRLQAASELYQDGGGQRQRSPNTASKGKDTDLEM